MQLMVCWTYLGEGLLPPEAHRQLSTRFEVSKSLRNQEKLHVGYIVIVIILQQN